MSRLPNTLNNAIYDLINISPFHPNILNTSFIMPCSNWLLNNYRSWGNNNWSRSDDCRLSNNYWSWTRSIVYG
jgi:hypothetical protein